MLTDFHVLNMTSSPAICEFPTLQHPVNHSTYYAIKRSLLSALWYNLDLK